MIWLILYHRHAADALAEAGATGVYASCTHYCQVQHLIIFKVCYYIFFSVVLDTIYLPEERLIDKIEQISIADLISEAIIRIHENVHCHLLF